MTQGRNIPSYYSRKCNDLKLIIEDEGKTFNVIGDSFSALGKVQLNICIDDIPMKTNTFFVFSSCNSKIDVLLGSDFLKMNNFEINARDRILIQHFDGGGRTELYLNDGGDVSNVMICSVPCYTIDNIKFAPNVLRSVEISHGVPYRYSQNLYFSTDFNNNNLRENIGGLNGIVDTDCKLIYLVNHETVTKVTKGEKIGTVSTYLELPNDSDDSVCANDSDIRKLVDLSELNKTEMCAIYSMLSNPNIIRVFSAGDNDIGAARVVSHNIKLTNDTPIYQRPRRFPKPVADEIEKQCAALQALDIIEPSCSEWSSPIVPIRKKDGSLRMCIDYRQLNRVTVSDKFPVPNLNDSIFGLHGTEYFSRLDLVKSYYQVPIDPDSRKYTAFSTPRNHWQFARLAFGLKNAPAAFQREIQSILNNFPSNKVIAYLDDILILASSFEEHFKLVEKVLTTLSDYGIKINPSKCELFKSEVEYLGHVVSRSGIKKLQII